MTTNDELTVGLLWSEDSTQRRIRHDVTRNYWYSK